jgi:hypothetical protein
MHAYFLSDVTFINIFRKHDKYSSTLTGRWHPSVIYNSNQFFRATSDMKPTEGQHNIMCSFHASGKSNT